MCFISGKKLAIFNYVVVSSHGKTLNGSTKNLNIFFFRSITTGTVLVVSPCGVRVKGRSGCLERGGVVLRPIEVNSEKTKMCDC